MRVFSKSSNKPLDLGILIACTVINNNNQVLYTKYRNEFYLNDAGQVVWDMFLLSRSTKEPVATLIYDVVKE